VSRTGFGSKAKVVRPERHLRFTPEAVIMPMGRHVCFAPDAYLTPAVVTSSFSGQTSWSVDQGEETAMSVGLVQTYHAFAYNNGWANHRLLGACACGGPESGMDTDRGREMQALKEVRSLCPGKGLVLELRDANEVRTISIGGMDCGVDVAGAKRERLVGMIADDARPLLILWRKAAADLADPRMIDPNQAVDQFGHATQARDPENGCHDLPAKP
jgi:hypothetical protein